MAVLLSIHDHQIIPGQSAEISYMQPIGCLKKE